MINHKRHGTRQSENSEAASIPFLLVAAVALSIGIYARFKGLGFAPIGIDEYYLSRSIDGIIKHGVPMFDCGGYYLRGLLLQYPIAGLRLLGLSPELAPRFTAALSSIALLPALFMIGRRFLSVNATLVAVSIVAISLWQIEMARFGRFYAPFQAVFAWYLVYYLRYTIERDISAWKGMALLTLLGAFVWEGSILLALANFVPAVINFAQSGRLPKREWLITTAYVVLLIALYVFIFADFRFASEWPAHPAGYSAAVIVGPSFKLDLVEISTLTALRNPLGALGILVILSLGAISLPWIGQWRHRPLAMLGLLVMLLAAMAHQFAVVCAVALVLVLLRQISWQELRQRAAIAYAATLLVTLIFWIVYASLSVDWAGLISAVGPIKAVAILLYQFVRFPDVVVEIIRPFASTVPVLGAMLFLALAIIIARATFVIRELRTPERVLILLMVLLLLAIGASDPPRHETRYSVFLYPLALLLFVAAVIHVTMLLRIQSKYAEALALAAAIALFATTEDFNPRHILAIDSPESTFRRNMSGPMQAHLGEARDDFRAVAGWLKKHASPESDIVVNGVHGVDYYYPYARYFYVDYHSSNFYDWSCKRGTIDRWTNLPLVYTIEDLRRKTSQARATYFITWTFAAPDFLAALAERGARVVMTEGITVIIALDQGA